MKRRQLLAAGAVGAGAAALGMGSGLFRDRGGSHSEYFKSLSGALDRAGLARPTLVIDGGRLNQNIDVLSGHLAGNYDYRVVAKSLPSVPLLKRVMERADTHRLMAFHQPFLNLISSEFPNSNVLLGKPMPVAAASRFYQKHTDNGFEPASQLQWLLDSSERLVQYGELANGLQQDLLVNLELDVGLHRGGIKTEQELVQALTFLQQHPRLQLSGFMGYEAHVSKMPGLLGGPPRAFAAAQQRYTNFVQVAEQVLGGSVADKVVNAAGSPTYQYYNGEQVANELSAGSSLVKPTDFDIDSLADHVPAAFIATPVLKSLPVAEIPGIEGLARLQSWINPNSQKAFFIYGGYWKALPESPPGLSINSLGRSTNQEQLNGSTSVSLQQDDWVFLRPTQSEHVFLQFGDIAVFEDGEIREQWPVFTQGA